MSTGKFHIGTSGWYYDHWKGPFYPDDLPAESMLSYYSKHFSTAEINNTFYNLPAKDTFSSWKNSVPEKFIFCPKASRYITHMKKLKDPEDSVDKFISSVETLEEKLGPILFQLPPKWSKNLDRLEAFLKSLPGAHKYAFEFRDPDWFGTDTDNIMKRNNAAFCIYDYDGRQSPESVTADFIYIRLHGPDGAYKGKYSDGALNSWSKKFKSWASNVNDIFCFFDNDESGYAAQNAEKLNDLLSIQQGS